MTDIIERLRIESQREPNKPIWRDAIDEIEALRAEVETGHYNWNRFMEPITSYFVYKPGFVIRPESAREDEGGPYASHPCGAAKNIMCYVDALEARAERLAKDAAKYRWGINNARWVRGEQKAYVAIPVAPDTDLSCIAMRDAAIDAAMEGEK